MIRFRCTDCGTILFEQSTANTGGNGMHILMPREVVELKEKCPNCGRHLNPKPDIASILVRGLERLGATPPITGQPDSIENGLRNHRGLSATEKLEPRAKTTIELESEGKG